jgi:cytochrome c oxidase subunit 2
VTLTWPDTAEAVDKVFLYIFGISLVLLILITAVMVGFAIRFHRSRQAEPREAPSSCLWLEITWTLVPTLIVLSMFWYGWQGYLSLANVPPDALPIKAVARQWSWSFVYPDGRTSPKLIVPAGRAIRIDIVSEDVLHSLYIPAFRIKKDAVPGMTTHVWFRAPDSGSFDLFCTEYCGLAHASMITTVEVLPADAFGMWLQNPASVTGKSKGRQLLEQYGCLACHSLDGSPRVGPSFAQLAGGQNRSFAPGPENIGTVDREYIERSILQPSAEVVQGFAAVMPSYAGKISDQDLRTLIEFLLQPDKTASPGEPVP